MEIDGNNRELTRAWLDKKYPVRRGAVGPVERVEHMPHSTEYPSSGRGQAEQKQREGKPAQDTTEQTEDAGVIYDRNGAVHPAAIPPSTLDVTG